MAFERFVLVPLSFLDSFIRVAAWARPRASYPRCRRRRRRCRRRRHRHHLRPSSSWSLLSILQPVQELRLTGAWREKSCFTAYWQMHNARRYRSFASDRPSDATQCSPVTSYEQRFYCPRTRFHNVKAITRYGISWMGLLAISAITRQLGYVHSYSMRRDVFEETLLKAFYFSQISVTDPREQLFHEKKIENKKYLSFNNPFNNSYPIWNMTLLGNIIALFIILFNYNAR